jgi:hypothetical protein
LFLGTHQDNTADMIRKGRKRVVRGESAPWSRLTVEKVLAIRASGESQRALAAQFNVSLGAISAIKRRKSWSWL